MAQPMGKGFFYVGDPEAEVVEMVVRDLFHYEY
jgi:hypothetical protein